MMMRQRARLERFEGLRHCPRVPLIVAGLLAFWTPMIQAAQIDIHNPGPGTAFGASVRALPNGNFVATDPSNRSVYLLDTEGVLISALGNALDGEWPPESGITVLADGNFVVCSPEWSPPFGSPGYAPQVGAATWVNGTTGLNGDVSASNSLTGTQAYDRVCTGGVVPLADGGYVVSSWAWNNGDVTYAGAATHCSGLGACTGTVRQENSLVGTSQSDDVGWAIVALTNGNYVVASPYWQDFKGAITLCNPDSGCSGQSVSAQNSLVGSATNDWVGYGGDASLERRYPGIVPLDNGNFVVVSLFWRNGGLANSGAATWVDGVSGRVGPVSAQNSLVGTAVGDLQGASVTPLVGGNYVVNIPTWDNGAIADAGASTWCPREGGCAGTVSEANSMVGNAENERVGGLAPATALSNGNYVVQSVNSAVGGALQSGAVTWCDGSSGCTGILSASNSLVGNSAQDLLGSSGITALNNGNYVVNSEWLDLDGITDIGASLYCGNANGCTGTVSASNSLTGSVANDHVGGGFPSLALSNGNYVVYSNNWQGDGLFGALTWVDGRKGLVGTVSADNSFVGIFTEPWVGGPRIFALPNGNYVSTTPTWTNGAVTGAGAITLLRGYGPQTGTIDQTNSVTGNVADAGQSLKYAYDPLNDTLIVGKPRENIVTLLRVDQLFFNGAD
ncbi:MAG TPA: hypothetical protein PKC03_01200 [Dokdonella sp.]|nr:hypothetical protein [Dokdonella sp.]